MKYLFSLVFVFSFFKLFGQSFYPKFAATTGLSARDMEIDFDGNLYVVGHGNVEAGCLQTAALPDSGNAFLAKFDAIGNLIWSLGFGGNSAIAHGLAIAPDGGVLVTGFFKGTVNLPSDSGNPQTLTSLGEEDIFVLKIDEDGNLIWAVSAGESSNDIGYDVAVDSEGNIFVTGTFQWEVDFNGQKINSTNFKNDAFIWSMSPDGTTRWADSYPSFFDSEGTRITIDQNDNVICTGSYFDQQVEATSFFVWKKSSGGLTIFQKLFSGSDQAFGFGISSDSKNNIIIVGQFGGLLDFDLGPEVAELSAPAWWLGDAFVLKLDENGDFIWVKQTGREVGFDSANAVSTDKNDNVFICGYFTGAAVDFDPGPNVFNLGTHVDGADIYTQVLSDNGDFIWAGDFEYDGFGQYDGLAIAVSTSGQQFYAGGMVRQGNFNGVIRGYSDCPIEVVEQDLKVCNSYNLNGTEISEFCNYRTSVSSGTDGCDTIFNINILPYGNIPVNVYVLDEELIFSGFSGELQWLNCDDFTAIDGEFGETFIPNETGSYAVDVLYFEGCRDTSDCVFIDLGTSIASEESDLLSRVEVFPNPFFDNIKINNLPRSFAEISVFNLHGKLLFESDKLAGMSEIEFSTKSFQSGIYAIFVKSRNEVFRKLVIKK